MPDDLIDNLTRNGWTVGQHALDGTRWLAATREYATDAGVNPAIVYCWHGRLIAHYQSEGRNVLDACSGTPDDLDVFLRDVEGKIANFRCS